MIKLELPRGLIRAAAVVPLEQLTCHTYRGARKCHEFVQLQQLLRFPLSNSRWAVPMARLDGGQNWGRKVTE